MVSTDIGLALQVEDWLDRAEARASFSAYCRYTMPGAVDGAHLRLIDEALTDVAEGRCDRLIVSMPPRHSKTFRISERFPAWYLGHNPDHYVIGASHGATLAEGISDAVRGLINDPSYPFPGIRVGKNTSAEWRIDGHRGRYIAVGVGGSTTGRGGDLIIIDDPVKDSEEAHSQRMRDKLETWYKSVIYGRRQPGAKIIIVMTRWHADDLVGRLLEQQEQGGDTWRVLNLPAIAEGEADALNREPGQVLWPEFWPEEEYHRIKRVLPPDIWQSQYQGVPVSQDGGMVRRHWFRFWQYRGMNLPPVPVEGSDGTIVQHPVTTLPGWFDHQMQSWDMSFKETSGGSYVVGLQIGVLQATSYVLARYRQRAGFPATVRAVQEMARSFPDTTTKLIEAKANGPAVIDTLRPSMPGMLPVETGDKDKQARMAASSWYIEGGNWILPHPQIAPWVREYIAEMVTFPKGAHDDQVDATSQFITHLEKNILPHTEVDIVGEMMAELGGPNWGGR